MSRPPAVSRPVLALVLAAEVRPSLGGPPAHVHREREEGFFILEGRYGFVRDGEEIELEAG